MGKIFDMVFPMIANHRDNSSVRKNIHPTDDTGKEIAPEGILSYIENSDKLDLKILKEQYDETFRTKEKIEDKAKTNIIGVSISITLIMGASGMLSVLNNKYPFPILSWVAFALIVVSIVYMLTAGILVIRLLTDENEVYVVSLNSLALDGETLRNDYDKCISQNRNKNIIRNNYLFTSYECIRNSLVCLFIILVLTTAPLSFQHEEENDSLLYSSQPYSFMYSSSAVAYIKKNNVQGIVENTIFKVIGKVEASDTAQTFGIVEESNKLFVKFNVIGNSVEILIIEPYID